MMDSGTIWPWLLVLLALALPAILIVIAIRRARAEDGVMTPGFKGWLFLLAASVWTTPLRGVVEVVRMLGDSGGVATQFPWLVRADLVISSITILLSLACLVLMLRRAAAFRWVFPAAAAWLVLNLPLSVAVARFLLWAEYGVRVGLGDLFAALAGDIPPWIGGVVVTLAWWAYVLRSRRVAMTFTRG